MLLIEIVHRTSNFSPQVPRTFQTPLSITPTFTLLFDARDEMLHPFRRRQSSPMIKALAKGYYNRQSDMMAFPSVSPPRLIAHRMRITRVMKERTRSSGTLRLRCCFRFHPDGDRRRRARNGLTSSGS